MNKLMIIFLVLLLVLWMITPLWEFYKSRTTNKRKFEHNALRHFNHLFVAIPFFIFSIWLFFQYDKAYPLYLNILILTIGSFLLILSLITFYLYFNYLLNFRVYQLIYNLENMTIEINGNLIRRNAINHVNWHKVKKKRLITIWSNFEHVEIVMHNGTRFVISSLLLNLRSLDSFFQQCAITRLDSVLPRIHT